MAVEDPRLGRPRKDVGKWGAITNKFLRVAHNEDGTLKETAGTVALLWDRINGILSPKNSDDSVGLKTGRKLFLDN